MGTHQDRRLSHPYPGPVRTSQTTQTWLPRSHTKSHWSTFPISRPKPGTSRRLFARQSSNVSGSLPYAIENVKSTNFKGLGILLTSFVNNWHIHLHPRISALIPKHLPSSRRGHVRNDGEARLPWWAWGGGSVAADIGCIVCDGYVEVVVAT